LELIGRLGVPTTSTEQEPLAFGITTPLLTTSSGQKFGKSAGNAIWLDPNLTSVLDFYQVKFLKASLIVQVTELTPQYFLNVEDADVEKLLKLLTLLPISDIHDIVAAHNV